jgi:hypothetical protein
VLQRIAIFRTAFTLDFAITVVSTSPAPIAHIVEATAGLVARSMLTASVSDDVVQYRLLEPTRVYAGEKLAASGSGRALARRQVESHLYLIRTAPGNWESQAGMEWLRAHAGRIDDVRAALDWCMSEAGDLPLRLSLTIAPARLWFQLSLTLECSDRIATALAALRRLPRPEPDIEMRLQAALGHAIWYSTGDVDHLEAAFGRALDLALQLGDAPLQLQALWGSWAAQRARGEFRKALTIVERYRTCPYIGRRRRRIAWRPDPWINASLSRQSARRAHTPSVFYVSFAAPGTHCTTNFNLARRLRRQQSSLASCGWTGIQTKLKPHCNRR